MASTDIDATHRTFVSYIDRTREYYRAQGYERPYRWAYFEDVPFTPLSKPLSQTRLTLITTSSPYPEDGELKLPKEVWTLATAEPPDRLFTSDLAWDKESTHTDDVDSFFPIHHLQKFEDDGRIGGLAPRCHGVPTEYSQRRTREHDAPAILSRCIEDGVEAALLVPL